MPNFDLINQPRFPIKTIDTDQPITEIQLLNAFGSDQGITLCVRSSNGHPKRGGYFFCILKKTQNIISLETIEGVPIDDFTIDRFLRFVNHCSGLKFDAEMLAYCQNSVNFRSDE